MAVAAGLLLTAQLCFLAAAGGILRPATVWALAACGLLLTLAGREPMHKSRHDRLGPGLLMAFGLAVFVLGLYPPDAFDEKVYHLSMARSLAEHGALRWIDNLRFPAFAQLTECLAAAVSLVAGAGADRAVHLVQGVSALAIAGLLLDRDRPATPWGAALWIGMPLVVYQAATLYVDVFLALAVTLAIVAAGRFERSVAEAVDGLGGKGWLAASAFAAGSAFAIKYSGALAALAVAPWILPAVARRRRWGSDLLVVVGFYLLAVGPTVVWLLAVSGNPVFPFLGDSAWQPAFPQHDHPWWRNVLIFPWAAYFDRASVGGSPPLSPFLPVALLAGFAAWRDLEARRLLLAAALLSAPILVLYPDTRYLLPVLPVLILFAARSTWVPRWLTTSRRRWIAGWLIAGPGLAYAVFHGHRWGAIPLDPAAVEAFLARRNVGLAALRAAEDDAGLAPPPRIYVFANETLIGLSRGRVYGDVNGRLPRGEVLGLLDRPADLEARLRDLGIRHLVLLKRSLPPGFDPAAPEWAARFRSIHEDQDAIVLRRL